VPRRSSLLVRAARMAVTIVVALATIGRAACSDPAFPVDCQNGLCCPGGTTCNPLAQLCCPAGFPVQCTGTCCPPGNRDQAATKPARAAQKLLRRAAKNLKSAAAVVKNAAARRRNTVSKECAGEIAAVLP